MDIHSKEVKELEKVKNWIFENTMLGIESIATINYINSRIKKLKKNK